MNADIQKYRVWNEYTSMYDSSFIVDQDGEVYRMIDCCENGYDIIHYSENVVVERCSGQRDKKGNLIYAGDVIKIKDDYNTYGQFAGEIREVYYHEGGFRLKPKWNKNARGNYLEDTEDFEIIGNIHDGKEY